MEKIPFGNTRLELSSPQEWFFASLMGKGDATTNGTYRFFVNYLNECVAQTLKSKSELQIQYLDISMVMFDTKEHPFCLSTNK